MIMTDRGWQFLGGMMSPMPEPEAWWRGTLIGLRIDHSASCSTWRAWEEECERTIIKAYLGHTEG